MFARTVSFHLKPGLAGEFTRLLDQDVMPTLRKQKGFQDESRSSPPIGRKRLGSACGTSRKTRTRMPATHFPV
jgi:hypothetical protein